MASSRYGDVDFHFLGAGEDSFLPGTVIMRDSEMVLNIPGGYGPYLIVGKACENWFEGNNSVREREYETGAKWAFLGKTYVGLWIEDGSEYLFSLQLGTPTAKPGAQQLGHANSGPSDGGVDR
jgi:hypothetical protein